MSDVLRLAVQKSGRLSDDSLQLIKNCGIKFSKSDNKLTSSSSNFPLEFLFLRDDDIPGYVADGVADLGIVGENVLAETEMEVTTVMQLGFSKCRLSIAIPKSAEYTSPASLEGLGIATSYPVIVKRFLEKHNVNAHIHVISGSVEIAPNIGLTEAICDIVSSGSTLFSNGLKEVDTVMESQAVLISNSGLSEAKKKILSDLTFRIRSVQNAGNNKYIVLNAPSHCVEKIKSLLPGMKSPTVVPLAEEGWCSVHSVVNENMFWDIIEKLKEAGAQGILVIPIEKMIL